VVKQIVDEYKGKIEVKSKPKEGTTFKIYFPTSYLRIPRGEVQGARNLPDPEGR
jgi:chemotaxis protein histidine kinase CheA